MPLSQCRAVPWRARDAGPSPLWLWLTAHAHSIGHCLPSLMERLCLASGRGGGGLGGMMEACSCYGPLAHKQPVPACLYCLLYC